MKKMAIVLIVMLTAGCAGMGMHGSGSSGGTSSRDSGTGGIYNPNFGPAYERLDSSFHPYFGG